MVNVNQVRHLFVVKKVVEVTPANEGEVQVCKHEKTGKVYIKYMGKGGLITSDYISPEHILYTNSTAAADEQTYNKKVTITLNPEINADETTEEALPVVGADYIIDVMVHNYIAMSDESTLVKLGAAHATSKMTASDLYKALAKSLARNFSREVNTFFKFSIKTASGEVEVTTTNNLDAYTATGLVIESIPQTDDYVRGEFSASQVNFSVDQHTICVDGDEVKALSISEENGSSYIGNGYAYADIEYFTMGERGDIYRQMGYPRTIRTQYTVDPTYEYDALNIAFSFVGRGVDFYKSDKLLTLIVDAKTSSVMGNLKTALSDNGISFSD